MKSLKKNTVIFLLILIGGMLFSTTKKTTSDELTLLTNGSEAFPEIIQCIKNAEETTTSFFHKSKTFVETVKIDTLKILYNPVRLNIQDKETELFKKVINHPNILVEKDTFKTDTKKQNMFLLIILV